MLFPSIREHKNNLIKVAIIIGITSLIISVNSLHLGKLITGHGRNIKVEFCDSNTVLQADNKVFTIIVWT